MTGHDPETGAEENRSGEVGEQPPPEPVEESSPSAAGPEGLAGGMGVSSERTGPAGPDPRGSGIEGTGSRGGAVHASTGVRSTSRGDAPPEHEGDELIVEPDPDSTGGDAIDRTVGEQNDADVPSHRNHEGTNPGHSHG
jgi:hypothetical protein